MERRHSLFSRIITVEPIVFFLVAIQGVLIRGGFLVQRSIRGRAAEMGLKISLLV